MYRKTLLIATDSFLPRWDGIARFLYEVVPFLKKHFDIVVVAPEFPGKLTGFDGVTVIRIPIFKWKVGDINPAKPQRKRLKQLIKNSDIIWTQSIGTIGAMTMYYAKKQHKPLISYVHSVEWFLFSKSLKRFKEFAEFSIRKAVPFLYNRCNLIIVPFEGMIPMLEGQGIHRKTEIVHLGVDINSYTPVESKRLAKEKLGLNPNNTVIGYLGRFGREKDIPTLYDAFKDVNHGLPNTTLLLVGGELDNPFDDMENVKVVPSTNNPKDFYDAMDIYVLPSLTETTSLTTMEAMSSGLPVVVTPVGYIPEYVVNRKNGFIFPCKSAERLAIILKKLVKDKSLRNKLGQEARRTMIQKHTWEVTANHMKDILDRF